MRRKLVTLEICAWCAGLLCVAALLLFRVEAGRAEQTAEQITRHQGGSAVHPPRNSFASSNDDLTDASKGVIGSLEVPVLHLRVPILNDYDPDSLRRGVGRIKGTGVPGGLGNFVVAGHRDTYFRPLRHISRGMTMHVVAQNGIFDYIVDATSIVSPEDVDVLDIGDQPEMTLITCYPFDFVGSAPKRFIVRGHLVSAASEAVR